MDKQAALLERFGPSATCKMCDAPFVYDRPRNYAGFCDGCAGYDEAAHDARTRAEQEAFSATIKEAPRVAAGGGSWADVSQATGLPPTLARGVVNDVLRDKHKISTKLRCAVLDRDGHACRMCGGTQRLTMDHIIPITKGGVTAAHNLQTLCKSCNSRKRDRTVAA